VERSIAAAKSLHYSPGMKRLILLPVLLVAAAAHAGKVVEEINPVSGLSRWHTEGQDFSVELIQLIPDFVRAVFDSKGLPVEIIDAVSSYCVFGTILRNRAEVPIAYNIADWRYVTADGVQHAGKLKSEWVSEWREMGVAFRWTLLPESQTYEVGDWGQGFTTVKLPPGTSFDLHYSWVQDGAVRKAVIEGLRCAPAELPK
jgi:hypothetical protein